MGNSSYFNFLERLFVNCNKENRRSTNINRLTVNLNKKRRKRALRDQPSRRSEAEPRQYSITNWGTNRWRQHDEDTHIFDFSERSVYPHINLTTFTVSSWTKPCEEHQELMMFTDAFRGSIKIIICSFELKVSDTWCEERSTTSGRSVGVDALNEMMTSHVPTPCAPSGNIPDTRWCWGGEVSAGTSPP